MDRIRRICEGIKEGLREHNLETQVTHSLNARSVSYLIRIRGEEIGFEYEIELYNSVGEQLNVNEIISCVIETYIEKRRSNND